MSTAREEVLARVRAAGRHTRSAEPTRSYRRTGLLGDRERVTLLEERLIDYRARVIRTSATSLRKDLEAVACGRIGVPPCLPECWRPAGAIVDDGLSRAELDALDGALTGCTIAIAETGTLILSGGEREGRRALTLVPDLHVCVVEQEQIVETVPEAFARLRGKETNPLTLISGPSATSDIELQRVEGVHGPRKLIVVIVGAP